MTLTEKDLDRPQVISVPRAARVLGLGRTAAYDAVARGDIPTIRIGRRIVVPVRALEKLLEGALVDPNGAGQSDGRAGAA